MSWATPAEASAYTGDTITQADLDTANAIVEILADVTEDVRENLKKRDLRLLKMMESFQAAWMKKQVDYTGRSDVTLVDQDGLSYSKGDVDMHILGPHAKRAYKKLSWNRTRTMNPLTPKQALVLRGKSSPETIGLSTDGGLADGDDGDSVGDWEPI